MTRRTGGDSGWTTKPPAQGKERVVVVNEINNETHNARKIIYLFLVPHHIMSANVKRLDPNATVLLVCDIQVKFSEPFLREGRPAR